MSAVWDAIDSGAYDKVGLMFLLGMLIALWLGQRWLQRRKNGATRRRCTRALAEQAYVAAMSKASNVITTWGRGTPEAQDALIGMLRAYDELQEADPRVVFGEHGDVTRAMEDLAPVNDRVM
ncbi:MAG TPA: hypothetical protein VMJ72_01485 [Candidatus Paceibacterota bacterium]|nr:hypothetical protein [Candidatus Paceibacterota bacterium]